MANVDESAKPGFDAVLIVDPSATFPAKEKAPQGAFFRDLEI